MTRDGGATRFFTAEFQLVTGNRQQNDLLPVASFRFSHDEMELEKRNQVLVTVFQFDFLDIGTRHKVKDTIFLNS